MKCGANVGGVLETRASKNCGNLIPSNKPIVTFLLDNACCEYVNFISGIEKEDRGLYTAYYTDRHSTQDAITKSRDVKYNKIIYTTDISSAENSLLDDYVVGVLRAGWDGRSIDSLYFWVNTNDIGASRIHCVQNGVVATMSDRCGVVRDMVMNFYKGGDRLYRSN